MSKEDQIEQDQQDTVMKKETPAQQSQQLQKSPRIKRLKLDNKFESQSFYSPSKILARTYGFVLGRTKAIILFFKKKLGLVEEGQVESKETNNKLYEAGEKLNAEAENVSDKIDSMFKNEEDVDKNVNQDVEKCLEVDDVKEQEVDMKSKIETEKQK